MFAILDPIIFPITIFELSFIFATILTTISGRLVPSATIVLPIKFLINLILQLKQLNY